MILVVGATGQLGSLITRLLLAHKKPVRMLVRPNSAYQPLAYAGAKPVFGDLKEPSSLATACQDVDVVITTANSIMRSGDDNVQTVDLNGNHSLIDTAKSAKVKQFIFTSALGADVNSPNPFMQAKAKSEAHLRESGLPYTIIAPNLLMEMWVNMVVGTPVQKGQPVTLIGEGRRKHTFISAADVAAFATTAVGHPAAMNRYLPLGGPQSVSWRDVITAFESTLGRKIPVRSVPPRSSVPGLPQFMSDMMTFMETFDSPLNMTETARTFGVTLTTLEEFMRNRIGQTKL